MKRFALAVACAPLALGACTQAEPAKMPAVTPAAEVVGEARDCLSVTQFNNSRIRNDWTIDFYGSGDKVWRVTLPNRCSGLRSADSFTYETSLTQLCKHDIIYPLMNYGGTLQRGAGCGMGPFVPVKLAK